MTKISPFFPQLSFILMYWKGSFMGIYSMFCWPLVTKVRCRDGGGKAVCLKGRLYPQVKALNEGRTTVDQVLQLLLMMVGMLLLWIHKSAYFSLRNSTWDGGNWVWKHCLTRMPWARWPLKKDFWSLNPGSCYCKHLPVLYCKDKLQHGNILWM